MIIRIVFFILIISINNTTLNCLVKELNDGIKVYKYSEMIENQLSARFYSDIYVTFDLKNSRYQISIFITSEGSGPTLQISQGSLIIHQDIITLIDKNNSMVFKGNLSGNTVVFITGVKYLIGKSFVEIETSPGLWYGIVEFDEWNNEYNSFEANKSNIETVAIGEFSDEYLDDNSNGLFIELSAKRYKIFHTNNGLLFEISRGTWKVQDGIIRLNDNDSINKFCFNIINKKTITPTKPLPFSNKISALKYVKSKNEK